MRTDRPLPVKPLSESILLPEIKLEDLQLRPVTGILAIQLRTGTYALGHDEKDAVDKLKLTMKGLSHGQPRPEKCDVIKFLEEISDNLRHMSNQRDAECRVYSDPWMSGALSSRAEATAFVIAACRVEDLTRDLAPKFLAKAPHCDCGKTT
jgi:hypothetical protein